MRGEATRVDDVDAARLDYDPPSEIPCGVRSSFIDIPRPRFGDTRTKGRRGVGGSKGGNSRGVRCFGGQQPHGGAFDTGGGAAEADHDILFPSLRRRYTSNLPRRPPLAWIPAGNPAGSDYRVHNT